jgi:hypothetical protein
LHEELLLELGEQRLATDEPQRLIVHLI